MYEHHASYVIIHLNRRCRLKALKGDKPESARLAKLASDVEREFPDAKLELDTLYPLESEEG